MKLRTMIRTSLSSGRVIMDRCLMAITNRPWKSRVLWAVTLSSSLSLGIGKANGWLAFAIFAIGTLLYERGTRLVSTLELTRIIEGLAKDVEYINHEHPHYRVIYEIGENSEDFFLYDMEIKAIDEGIVAEEMHFGAQGEGVGQIRNFRDLRMHAWTNKGRVHILPFGPKTREVEKTPIWPICALFTVPISPGEVRQLKVSGIWPDLWFPLRKEGRDNGSWHVDKFTKRLEIIITFPRGIEEAGLSLHQRPKSGKTTVHLREDWDTKGRLRKILIIERAEPGDYVYYVTCSQLPGLLGQRTRSFLRRWVR